MWFEHIEQKIQLEELEKIQIHTLAMLGKAEEAGKLYTKLLGDFYTIKKPNEEKQDIVETLKRMESKFTSPIKFKPLDDDLGLKSDLPPGIKFREQ